MRRRGLILVVAAAVLAAGGALAVVLAFRGDAAPGVLRPSGPIPAIDAAGVRGGRVTPDLYRGKVVVVNFWASWCDPCRLEQPGLERLWRAYRGRGVQFVGVDFNDDRGSAREYLDEFDVTYPSAYDPGGVLAFRFGMLAPPTTFLADRRGELRYHLLGAQSEETVRRYIEELLAEDSR